MAFLRFNEVSMSAYIAFHQVIMKRLYFSFEIKENTVIWVKLFLADTNQCVSVVNKTSTDVRLYLRVSEGFVLG